MANAPITFGPNRPPRETTSGRNFLGPTSEAERADVDGAYSRKVATGTTNNYTVSPLSIVGNISVNDVVQIQFPDDTITDLGGGVVKVSGGANGDTPPHLADWTWVHQGGATNGSPSRGGFFVRVPVALPGAAISFMSKSQPSVPYTVDVGWDASCSWPDVLGIVGAFVGMYDNFGVAWGIVLYNSDTRPGSIDLVHVTNLGGVTVISTDVYGLSAGQRRYVRITNDGATMSAYVSASGDDWLFAGSEAVGAFTTPTRIALGIRNINSLKDAIMTFRHYSEH